MAKRDYLLQRLLHERAFSCASCSFDVNKTDHLFALRMKCNETSVAILFVAQVHRSLLCLDPVGSTPTSFNLTYMLKNAIDIMLILDNMQLP